LGRKEFAEGAVCGCVCLDFDSSPGAFLSPACVLCSPPFGCQFLSSPTVLSPLRSFPFSSLPSLFSAILVSLSLSIFASLSLSFALSVSLLASLSLSLSLPIFPSLSFSFSLSLPPSLSCSLSLPLSRGVSLSLSPFSLSLSLSLSLSRRLSLLSLYLPRCFSLPSSLLLCRTNTTRDHGKHGLGLWR